MHSRRRHVWTLDERKFLTAEEVVGLRSLARHTRDGGRDEMLRWLVVELVLASGLRVCEVARLVVGDVSLAVPRMWISVREGKGGKSRTVFIGDDLALSIKSFLAWKVSVGEPTYPTSPLLYSSRARGPYSRRFLQKLVKSAVLDAGLAPHVSIHCLRHTYAVHLYKSSGHNMRLVQKQLGHSSIQVTQVYADVVEDDVQHAVRKLYATEFLPPRSHGGEEIEAQV